MFLIPIGTDTKFRKFPIITLCLIIVMTLIFAIIYNKSKNIENEKLTIEKQIQHRTKLIEGFKNDNSIERFFYDIIRENGYIKGE